MKPLRLKSAGILAHMVKETTIDFEKVNQNLFSYNRGYRSGKNDDL